MFLWSDFSKTRADKTLGQPSPTHAALCWTEHSTKWGEPLCVSVCVWRSGQCHCAHWLSVSALTVIPVVSQQFTHSRAKWDLPGSLSKYLKQKIDVTVCLLYIVELFLLSVPWSTDHTNVLLFAMIRFFFSPPFLCFLVETGGCEFWLDSWWALFGPSVGNEWTLDRYIFNSRRDQIFESVLAWYCNSSQLYLYSVGQWE